ncbi:uncharacterized protein LOC110241704 isoform X3 [Exaiptasia diaphana]|uniref:Sulfotransferase family protein n=1 Tax=Exaiptasia diaphana TaxID=2652724 RepID=A0A913YN85_EXADI|nr:uncharacterized protein LOC110241704 isoform X3 [Exaiptasia diaphana]
MKFICAGLPKTGTKSIAHALRILGFKVWDFDEQILYYMDEWLDFFQHGKPLDFYSMFKDVDAVVDLPSSFFFEEIMEAFPDAKVILSERDEESWAKSLKNQYDMLEKSYKKKIRIFFPQFRRFLGILLNYRMAALGVVWATCPHIYRKRYRWHNDRVKSVVPKEKLLLYRVEHGWKPLCEFTGKTIPDQPFPYLNVKGQIIKSFLTDTELGRRIDREVKAVTWCSVILVALIGTFLAILYHN